MKNPATNDVRNEIIRAELLAIAARNDGLLNPADVIEVARDPSSALHDHFEWDDDAAAAAYRLAQARSLIRTVKLTVVRSEPKTGQVKISTTREFQSRPSNRRSDGGYESVADIMKEPDKRAELLAQVIKELAAYRRRYADLMELSEVWTAVDSALDLFASEPAKASEETRAGTPAA